MDVWWMEMGETWILSAWQLFMKWAMNGLGVGVKNGLFSKYRFSRSASVDLSMAMGDLLNDGWINPNELLSHA